MLPGLLLPADQCYETSIDRAIIDLPFASELTASSRPFEVNIAIFEGRFKDMPLHENERPPK